MIHGFLNPLIHEPSRLRIVVLLAECEMCNFNFVLQMTGLTRGNLTIHMGKLVSAGYVHQTKEFVGNRPSTTYRLTPSGREAWKTYMKEWKRVTKGGGPA